jgi:hypothetical protein
MKPLARRLLVVAGKERQEIEAVEMDFERLVADRVPVLRLLSEVCVAVGRPKASTSETIRPTPASCVRIGGILSE